VVVRLSDFKTNEYAQLIGGESFEPHEENPMLGFRGACRYYDDRYREAFALECEALRRVRSEMGFDNVVVMVPFCRTLEEADRVLEVMAEHGLRRGEDGLQVYVMCEVPSNVMLAPEFAERFDGFSIGSNDLTQLVLGVDRDSGAMTALFDERNEAVVRMIRQVIRDAHAGGAEGGDLRTGPLGPPGLRRVPGGGGDRFHLPEPGQRPRRDPAGGGGGEGERPARRLTDRPLPGALRCRGVPYLGHSRPPPRPPHPSSPVFRRMSLWARSRRALMRMKPRASSWS
jgi:hypothetical protein